MYCIYNFRNLIFERLFTYFCEVETYSSTSLAEINKKTLPCLTAEGNRTIMQYFYRKETKGNSCN